MKDIYWQQLVNDLGPRLYRYFCGTFEPAVAADLVQDTLIRLVQKHREGTFDPDLGSIQTYAFGIARFVRLEPLNVRADFELVEDEKHLDVASANNFDPTDRVAHLRWAIQKLKPIEQEILLLMIDDEFQLEQGSDTLQIPLGTVKSHVHRAKENLRKIMEVTV